VEDAAGVRSLASRVLRSLGYEVLEAENGFDALSLISRHGIQAIHLTFTDVTMPKMGGPELVERIRALEPAARVLFTSGAPGADTALKAFLDQPGTNFLHKPFTPADLARVVHETMSDPTLSHLNGAGNPAPMSADAA
jgi:CheY-like chemotaxis protein